MDKIPVYSEADDNLIIRMLNGNKEALEYLYDQTKDAVYAFALAKMKNAEDARKTAVNTYVKVWKRAGEYKVGSGNLLCWILKLCREECIKTKRSKIDRVEEFDSVCNNRPILRHVMENYPAYIREIIVLRSVTEFSYLECHHVLKMPVSAIQNVCIAVDRKIDKTYGEGHTRKHRMRLLKDEVQGIAPDIEEEIIERCDDLDRKKQIKYKKSHRNGFAQVFAVVCIVIFIAAGILYNSLARQRSYITIDTLSDVIMSVDGIGDVRGLASDDGGLVFDPECYEDKELEEVFEYLGDMLVENGCISDDNNCVLLTVQLSGIKQTDNVRQIINSLMEDENGSICGKAIFLQDLTNGERLTNDDNYDIGKEIFVKEMSEQLEDCSEDDLIELSIQDLAFLYIERDLQIEGVEIIGEPSFTGYNGLATAKDITDSIDKKKYTIEQRYTVYNGELVIEIKVYDGESINTIILDAKTGSLETISIDGNSTLVEEDEIQEIIEPGSTQSSSSGSYSSGYSSATGTDGSDLGSKIIDIIDTAEQPFTSDAEKASRIISDVTDGVVNIDPNILNALF